MDLNTDQKKALEILRGDQNVFLTGAAGSGKSFLLREFLRTQPTKSFPVLASTGAAAILVGGRTFHSFFGLGILEKGVFATVERAVSNRRVIKRIREVQGIVIDEVSMLSGPVLQAAELIARKIRGNSTPWGGIRIIAVGDFAQLPPVNVHRAEREWAFLDDVWKMSEFRPAVLNKIMRSKDTKFLEVLNQIRNGIMTDDVTKFLNSRSMKPPEDFKGTRLFARREDVERHNLKRLDEIRSQVFTFDTVYSGQDAEIEKFRKHSPIGDFLTLKKDALIMFRQNDQEGRWVNGSLGNIQKISEKELTIELLSGKTVQVGQTEFTLLNAEGDPVVTAKNFPVTLAWAITIHKAQGTTLDQMSADLRGLWEPGQAYVAISRAKNPDGLFLEGWYPSSLKSDPLVHLFHRNLFSN